MTATTLPRNPVTIQAEMDQLSERVQAAKIDHDNAIRDCLEENGVCMRCKGKGKIMVVYSMDFVAEYGEVNCEDCNGKDDKAKVKALLADFHGEYERLSNELNALDNELGKSVHIEANPKGYRVRVTAKRAKVKQGTEGLCFWVGQTQYGFRVGFKTDAGETIWTALDNVSPVWEA